MNPVRGLARDKVASPEDLGGATSNGMKKTLIILLVIIAGISIAFIFRQKDVSESVISGDNGVSLKVGINIGNIAPDFEVKTYDGETIRLSDYRGKKPVFINFWAAWCPFCVEELPLMAEVQKENGDKYITLAVNRGESIETARKFSDDLNVTDSMMMLLNKKDDVYRRYGGFAMPYSLFLDKDGVIVDVKRGPLIHDELHQKINLIIN